MKGKERDTGKEGGGEGERERKTALLSTNQFSDSLKTRDEPDQNQELRIPSMSPTWSIGT